MTTIVSAIARRRRASASSRSRPWAMILAIIESNSAGIDVALGDAGVDADAGAGGQAQQRDPARASGAKPRSGSSALRRASMAWPRGGRRVALEPAAGGDVELQLDEVDAGDHLGDGCSTCSRVLTSMNENRPLVGLVEELDRAGAAVAGAPARAARRVARARAPARASAPGWRTPR